jgi:uncharacterized protein
MKNEEVVMALVKTLQEEFAHESTGHDWFHIERVWKNAKLICSNEDANAFVVELGALLHDIADHKFVKNSDIVAQQRTIDLLTNLKVEAHVIEQVLHIVLNCSYKGGVGDNKMESIEGLIVQDADRLDAIGAIGIARAFAFGGKFDRQIYDPNIAPTRFKTIEEYKTKQSHTVNHFYEKLLLLKDQMNTKTGKALALKRHEFMQGFLQEFYAEWKGES